MFAIGDPGRAAVELPDGSLSGRAGPADTEISVASPPGMLIRAASGKGLLHRAKGTPRQDAFALARVEGEAGQVVGVVCDGVGEFGRSDEAARFVSRRLADLGVRETPWPEAFEQVNEELRRLAQEAIAGPDADVAADGMATTAVAVSVHRDAAGWAGTVAWVGDSTLWHLGSDRKWSLITGLGDEADGDYHSTAVRPLPSADGGCRSQPFQLPGGALFVMTDGVANLLRWSDEVLQTLAEWWMQPPDPFTFAAQVSFARKSHMDDRTVIGIWPDGSEGESQEDGPGTAGVPG
jgi:hypothetical protein